MEMILNTLVYDGKVERILAGDGSNLYRAIQPLVTSPGLIRTPCGMCPVRHFTNILYLLNIYQRAFLLILCFLFPGEEAML